ncbi:MAG: 50S ribosomal protein L3 [Candidatus Poribacteria bacterium]|nr:50S ribosomal protein L3 [Candidatus Poribacteria bacterium]
MSAGIIGKKVGMTRIFDATGAAIAVTVIEAGPCPVVQVKSVATDTYNAVQLGFGTKKRPNRPMSGHFQKSSTAPSQHLREFRLDGPEQHSTGEVINVTDLFNEGDLVDVTGITKGKGFAGVVKRHGFKGGRGSHGSEKDLRRPGSIGTSAWPSRVPKGRKMGGHMGHVRSTVQNLRVIQTNADRHLLVVKGAVPGPNNGLVIIRKAAKAASGG